MAITTTGRFGFKKYGAGTDPHPNRTEFNALMDLLENNAAMQSQGLLSARPTAGKRGRVYWSTDAPKRLFYDDGTTWEEVGSNGGGGAGAAIAVGGTAVEGTATRSARADHTHALPLATSAINGAMRSTDKAKLDNAVSAATASRLVIRDAAGRAQFVDPSAAADAATKGYVDQIFATGAPTTHTHTAAQTVSGVFAAARLPAVTTTVQGAMIPADKVKLDAAGSLATPSTLVMLDSAGRARVGTPSVAADIAHKGYVDGQIGTRAPSSHSHAWTDLTGIPTTFTPASHNHSAAQLTSGVLDPARLPAASSGAQGAMSGADKAKLDAAANTPTASRLVMRDTAGRAAFANPLASDDAATKGYVDGAVGGRALSSHTHTWGQISGVPSASTTTAGLMPADFYRQIAEAAYTDEIPNALVRRASNGVINVPTPSTSLNAANKAYVDAMASWDQISGKPTLVSLSYAQGNFASTNHGHPGTDLTSPVPTGYVVGSARAWSTTSGPSSWASVNVGSDNNFFKFSSTLRHKTNVVDYPQLTAFELVQAMRPVTFDRKDGSRQDEIGLIAEELHEIAPQFTFTEDDGKVGGINYQMLVTPLIGAIQELTERVARLEA